MSANGMRALPPWRRAWLKELGVEEVGPGVARRPAGAEVAAMAGRVASPAATVPATPADAPLTAPAAAPLVEPVPLPVPASAAPVAQDPAPTPAMASVPLPAADGPSAGGLPAVHTLDWDALGERVQACEACGLCEGRTQTVFGVGARPARWLVVGEAPGEQEDRKGEPFVGRSGKLLDSMLAAAGRSRKRDVFIANVIKCRPPGNRDPLPEEVARCSPYLMRQIELLQPAAILILGRFAAQTLLATDARIGSLRGRTHAIAVGERSVPAVVSYHPAYLLRSPHEKSKAWEDLQRAMALDVG